MRPKVLLTTAALAAIFVLAVPASATSYTWTGSDATNPTLWNVAANWDPSSGYPDDTGDTATIPDVTNDPVVNTDITVGTVTIQSGGSLTVSNPLTVVNITVNSGATLTGNSTLKLRGTMTLNDDADIGTLEVENTYTGSVDANGNTFTVTGAAGLQVTGTLRLLDAGTVAVSGGGDHVINGDFELEYSGSVFAITTADSSLTGSGNLIGEHNDALVTIASGVTLTNQITMKGRMQITDATSGGTFDNDRTVWADHSGILAISPTTVTDSSSALIDRWKVTVSGAKLSFDVAATCLTTPLYGSFVVSNGTLDISETIFTVGELTQSGGGKIDVASGKSFSASAACP